MCGFLPVLVIFLIDFYVTEKTYSLLIVFNSCCFFTSEKHKDIHCTCIEEKKILKASVLSGYTQQMFD